MVLGWDTWGCGCFVWDYDVGVWDVGDVVCGYMGVVWCIKTVAGVPLWGMV